MRDPLYNDDLEAFLQQQVNKHRMYASGHVWQSIQDALHERRRWPALTFILLFIISLLVIGTLLVKPEEHLRFIKRTPYLVASSAPAAVKADSTVVPLAECIATGKTTERTIAYARQKLNDPQAGIIASHSVTASNTSLASVNINVAPAGNLLARYPQQGLYSLPVTAEDDSVFAIAMPANGSFNLLYNITEREGDGSPTLALSGMNMTQSGLLSRPLPMPGISEAEQPEISGVGLLEISKVRQPEKSKTGQPGISEAEQPDISGVGLPEISKVRQPEKSKTGQPEISKVGQPGISEAGLPEISKVGRPEKSEAGLPEISKVGQPDKNKTGRSEKSEGGQPVAKQGGSVALDTAFAVAELAKASHGKHAAKQVTKADEIAEDASMPEIVYTDPEPSRWEFHLYVTPSASYRKLVEEKTYKTGPRYVGTPMAPNYLVDVNSVVRHTPARGMEIGFALGYRLNDQFTLRAGLQYNMRQYNIEASGYSYELTRIALNGRDTITTYTPYRNIEGNYPVVLHNKYHEVSLPLGINWTGWRRGRWTWGVSTTVQPTYTFNKQPFIISSDFKNYTNGAMLTRRWNFNTAFEMFLTYTTGNVQWQLGPQFRYQQFSSFKKQYPIKEYLLDYGIKLGMTTPL